MAKTLEPWDKPNPRKKAGKASKPLGARKTAKAKSIARSHGRSRPSLVDNMNAARSKKTSSKKASTKKASTKKASAKKSPAKTTKNATKKRPTKTPVLQAVRKAPAKTSTAPTKDPRGGLTAAGRGEFARKDGSKLKPGVQSHGDEMSPEDIKRKGSWAVRFYGRDPLPPLVNKKGDPTRFALSAHAWGEPVPKTDAAARRIAAKGRKLLERYNKIKDK